MRVTDTRPLRAAGLRLPVFGLGCSGLGGLHRSMTPEDCNALVAGALDAGVRFFDTAPYYGHTASERRLGAALSSHDRDDLVLSTKVGRLLLPDVAASRTAGGWSDAAPFRVHFDYSGDGILRSVDESLQRLGVARLDLVLVHDIGRATHGQAHPRHWDALTRGGGFKALQSLRRQGVARAIGLGVNEWEVARDSLDHADLDCTMLAGRYTLLDHVGALDFMDACARRDHAIIAAAPFNSGVLAGGTHFDYRQVDPATASRVDRLRQACARHDVPLAAAALQFPLLHPAVAACVAGAHSAAELAANIRHLERPIPGEFWEALRDEGSIDARVPLPMTNMPGQTC